ncbi:MAG: gliding motility-associated C-terminal domain-containing protein [Bacteroidales bacterium]|nr:gliding motility-associated C-terminal domain-containing protein [Bacteroidales bacterium]
MKRLILYLLLLFVLRLPAFATHQRAGEITYRYISGLTYEITITSYSYAPSPADRNELEINWGDGSSSILTRINGPSGINPAGLYCDHLGEIVGPEIKKNLYTGEHTFPGPSTYRISVEDPNRNYGIMNIPSSVDIPLYIETLLSINPFIGPNSSPQLLLPPIDRGCVDHPFLHNPGAFDPDGDSLSYVLTVCKGAGGQPIPGYILPNLVDPNGSSNFSINSVTGDINWISPTLQGEYNISFMIEEWRNGSRIGFVTRDMQITIVTCTNDAPIIDPINDTCITAGDSVGYLIRTTDPNLDKITLTATGAPLLLTMNAANFSQVGNDPGIATGIFTWETDCSQIRKNPYQVFFKAVDNSTEVNLFDLKTLNIRIVGPKTENLEAIPLGNNINIFWSPNRCSNVVTYKVYRRNGFFGYIPANCETGVPSYTGYRWIKDIDATDTTFSDGNEFPGLAHGVDYCYMIVAVYPDGSESYASDEVCVKLKKDVPVITNVSIEITDVSSGKVYLAWSKPTEIDPLQAPGPYKYLIYRSFDFIGSNAVLIDSLNSLDDTLYFDEPFNTKDQPISYRVDLINDTPGLRFIIGPSQVASSVYLSIGNGDNKLLLNFPSIVPWTNHEYVIYRKNELTQIFDSISTTTLPTYTDLQLINGQSYCYRIKSIGSYGTTGITDPLINFSQEVCGIPADNEPPCPPELTVEPDCDRADNILRWVNASETCADDVVKYYVYYRPPLSDIFVLLDSLSGINSTTFTHDLQQTIAGCYSIRSIDSIGNISMMSDTICIDSDTCGGYRLPNVFTPNADTYNDYFTPYPYSSVEKIDLTIFNRWGTLIFKTDDPDIEWDGKIIGTNQPASDGVYYYVCDVFEITLYGTIKRTLKGSVTIIR